MQKIYSNTSTEKATIGPKKETLDFLTSYSKALTVLKCEEETFDVILN